MTVYINDITDLSKIYFRDDIGVIISRNVFKKLFNNPAITVETFEITNSNYPDSVITSYKFNITMDNILIHLYFIYSPKGNFYLKRKTTFMKNNAGIFIEHSIDGSASNIIYRRNIPVKKRYLINGHEVDNGSPCRIKKTQFKDILCYYKKPFCITMVDKFHDGSVILYLSINKKKAFALDELRNQFDFLSKYSDDDLYHKDIPIDILQSCLNEDEKLQLTLYINSETKKKNKEKKNLRKLKRTKLNDDIKLR